MMRSSGAAYALLGLTMVSAFVADDARAQVPGPHMWGIGPKLGMIIIPGRYPYAFPDRIRKYDFIEEGTRAGNPDAEEPDRDLDVNGNPLATSLTPVGFDLRLGGEGFYGIDALNRIGAGVGLGFGTRYSDYWLSLNYDRVLFSNNPFDVVAGVQIGYGGATWSGEDEDEKLKMSYYPIRARLAGQFRDKTRMYGLGLFVQDAVPARTTYTDLAGQVQESVGSPGNFVLFLSAGLEIDVQFGDFTAPRKKPPVKKPAPPAGGGSKAPKTGTGSGGSGGSTGAKKPKPK